MLHTRFGMESVLRLCFVLQSLDPLSGKPLWSPVAMAGHWQDRCCCRQIYAVHLFFSIELLFFFEWPRSCIRRNSLWSLIFINRVSRFLVKIQHKFIYLFTNIGMKQCLLNSRRSEKCYTSGSYSQFDKSICCWCLANDGYADRLPFLAQPWRRMLKWRGTFKAMA